MTDQPDRIEEERVGYQGAKSNGYVQLPRAFMECPAMKLRILDRALAVHIVMTANWKEGVWSSGCDMVNIYPGQRIVGRRGLAKEIGCTEQKLRTSLNHLKTVGFLTLKSTRHYTLITITEPTLNGVFDLEDNPQSNHQLTQFQPSSNHNRIREEGNKERKDPKPSVSSKKKDFTEHMEKLKTLYENNVKKGLSDQTKPRFTVNVGKLLKAGRNFDKMWNAILCYAAETDGNGDDPRYRLGGGNFFGRDKLWEQYMDKKVEDYPPPQSLQPGKPSNLVVPPGKYDDVGIDSNTGERKE